MKNSPPRGLRAKKKFTTENTEGRFAQRKKIHHREHREHRGASRKEKKFTTESTENTEALRALDWFQSGDISSPDIGGYIFHLIDGKVPRAFQGWKELPLP